MGQANDRSLALALTALVAATTACLPRGEPPAGRQVVAGRKNILAAIAPPNGDGVLRILFFRPGAAPDSRDLYVVAVDAAGEPQPERLLIAGLDITADLGCIGRIAPCSIDPAGWTWVYPKNSASGSVVGVNTITGERLIRDLFAWPVSSASGQRVFLIESTGGSSAGTETNGRGTLQEPDGRMTTVDFLPLGSLGASYAFYGEDFYYLTPAGELMRSPPSGPPEPLATGVGGFYGYPTTDGRPLMILVRPTDEPELRAYAVRDPVTGRETSLGTTVAFSLDLQASPDGRLLLIADAAGRRFTFLDVQSGVAQEIPFPADYGGFGGAWRPGTLQIWVTTGASEAPTVQVLSPEAPPVSVPGLAFAGFADDGAFWMSTATGPNETYKVLQIGSADDPTGPRRFITPDGTYLDKSWPRADHRWLMTVFTKDYDRSDVFAFDLVSGERRLLAERGRVAAVGDTRLLGMFRLASWRGDLTVVDIDSGQQTILAPEFAVTAFAEPQGSDRVAPGTRIVYEFQARNDSPYDGLWLVNAP